MKEFLCGLCTLAKEMGSEVPCTEFSHNGEHLLTVCNHVILVAANKIVEESEKTTEVIH